MDDKEICGLLKTAKAVAAREIPASEANPVRITLKNGNARMFRKGKNFVFEAKDARGASEQRYSVPREKLLEPKVEESFTAFLTQLQMPNRNIIVPTTIVPKWQNNGAQAHRFD